MKLQLTLDDGAVVELTEESAIEIVVADSVMPKSGYRRVREYPPHYVRTNTFGPNVLAVGQRLMRHNGVREIVKIERG